MDITSYLLGKQASGGGGGSGLDWSAIGYSGEPQAIIDGYNYAVEIMENWTPATSLSYKFNNNKKLTFMPLVDTSITKSMGDMFYNCSSLISVPNLNMNLVTNQGMESMFQGCSSLTDIKISITSNITSIKGVFKECYKLSKLPQMDTSNVTNMQEAFLGCKSLTTMPQIDTSKVTNMQSAFSGCDSLISIPLLNTSNVTAMQQLFNSCNVLKDIPQLNTSNATNMTNMFWGCRSLTDTSLDNILQMCIGATSYTGTKTLKQLGLQASYHGASRIEALPHYQDFIDAGWTIGY